MRSFLSYDIDEPSLLSRIGEVQRGLLTTGADLKLVNPELLHFTIRFLGEIYEVQKEEIIRSLEGSLPMLDVVVKIKGLGTFPSATRISVIWLGSDPDSARKLSEQAIIVNKILEKSVKSLKTEDRFNPHVTIARVKSGRNKSELVKFLGEHSNDEFGNVKLGFLRLKLSVLATEGPSYSDLHVFK